MLAVVPVLVPPNPNPAEGAVAPADPVAGETPNVNPEPPPVAGAGVTPLPDWPNVKGVDAAGGAAVVEAAPKPPKVGLAPVALLPKNPPVEGAPAAVVVVVLGVGAPLPNNNFVSPSFFAAPAKVNPVAGALLVAAPPPKLNAGVAVVVVVAEPVPEAPDAEGTPKEYGDGAKLVAAGVLPKLNDDEAVVADPNAGVEVVATGAPKPVVGVLSEAPVEPTKEKIAGGADVDVDVGITNVEPDPPVAAVLAVLPNAKPAPELTGVVVAAGLLNANPVNPLGAVVAVAGAVTGCVVPPKINPPEIAGGPNDIAGGPLAVDPDVGVCAGDICISAVPSGVDGAVTFASGFTGVPKLNATGAGVGVAFTSEAMLGTAAETSGSVVPVGFPNGKIAGGPTFSLDVLMDAASDAEGFAVAEVVGKLNTGKAGGATDVLVVPNSEVEVLETVGVPNGVVDIVLGWKVTAGVADPEAAEMTGGALSGFGAITVDDASVPFDVGTF